MMALTRGLPRFALAVATLLAAAACGDDDGPTDPGGDGQVDAVVVTPAADTLTALGATVQLSARALDAAGDEVPGVSFTWTSLDDGVVAVSDSGVATAAGNGAARITATAEGVSDTASLAVVQLVETVSVSPSSATLTTAGATQQFTAAATDANGNAVADASVLWQSSRPGVASVDTTGLATAEASGETTITASAQGVPGNAVLTVDQEIAGGATPHGTRTVTTTAGVASFGGIWLDKAGAGYTLTVDVDGIPADTSASFDVTAAAPTRVGFVQQPTATEGAEALAPVTVAVQDEFGNTVPGATHAVELAPGPDAALAPGPDGGEAVLSGETSVQAVDGLATFDSVQIDLPGSYTPDATSFPLSGARSADFDVSLTFASVDAGQELSCGRTDPGHVYCWGDGSSGQLGDGTTTLRTMPTRVVQ
ncbi:MAG: Ig-like domain-containing protein [Gemmatimonadota bacterium]